MRTLRRPMLALRDRGRLQEPGRFREHIIEADPPGELVRRFLPQRSMTRARFSRGVE